MAENCGICLLGVMDRLWFHRTVLFPDPHSLCFSEPPKETSLPISDSNSQTSLIPEEEISSAKDEIIITPRQDECSIQDSADEKEKTPKERPTRSNLSGSKTRSHSSSPSNQKRSKIIFHSPMAGPTPLQKTMSCKSLRELEHEEVKGFMDLGFRFSKEHITKRLMSVIPGLQAVKKQEKTLIDDSKEASKDEDNNGEEEKGVIRPYLSEAWLIKRPDSPLLNLRIPRASAAADMKEHLKYWARTVATVIQQES